LEAVTHVAVDAQDALDVHRSLDGGRDGAELDLSMLRHGCNAGREAGAEANQHIFDRCCAEILRSKHFGMVGIETELRLALLILSESEKVADSGAAVCAVHPIAGRLPAEPGRLGSLGEGLAGADQRFDVDTVVHGSGRYGHRSLLWLVALSETSPSGSNEK